MRIFGSPRAAIATGIAVGLLLVPTLVAAEPPSTAPASELTKPVLINLSMKNATVRSVLNEVQKQSRISVAALGGNDEARIDVSFINTPWLEAIMRVCEASKLQPTIVNGDRWALTSSGARLAAAPRAGQGATMVVLNSFVVERNITLDSTSHTARKVLIGVKLLAEPSVELAGVSAVSEAVFVDQAGRSHPATLRAPSTTLGLGQDFMLVAPVPDRQAEKIASVSGTIVAPVLAEQQDLLIPNALASIGKAVPFGGGAVTIVAVRQRGPKTYEVDVRFGAGALTGTTPPHVRSIVSRARPVQTNKSQPANAALLRLVERDGAWVVTLQVEFQNPPSPDTEPATPTLDLSWNLPVKCRNISIPFRIDEIQLP